MATQPPAETPPPSQPTQPDTPPPEFPTPGNDVDVPSPQPGTMGDGAGGDDAGGDSGANPIGFAASSGVGSREAGDTSDIGGTDGMQASTGGLAGTSR